MSTATAFWVDSPGEGSFHQEPLPEAGPGDVVVRTVFTGVSRGTETTVFLGRVPTGEHQRMRAPFQDGEYPGPVKYGYLNVGVVEQGDAGLVGRTVFSLFPHQSRFVIPADAVFSVPDGVPPRRAVLAGAVETAVNILWDSAPLVGDRVTVIGAGMIGSCVARLASRLPGAVVTLVDVHASREAVADRLGVRFAPPDRAPSDQDVVVNASGSASGLQLGLERVVDDGEVVEASWYGDRPVTLTLGADFHSRRLGIRASQVGRVSSRRRDHRSTRDRLELALHLLRDEAFDALLTGSSPWSDLPEVLSRLSDGRVHDLCHTIDWEGSS